ncbi:hypothetical protein WBK31_10055 [Nonomuraea sp. N2-4H]|uniref:hypothetical protein n=1 Tax=Nonomuraea sp. N2-4H TaxID=3128898 RepID=UPI00324FAB8D
MRKDLWMLIVPLMFFDFLYGIGHPDSDFAGVVFVILAFLLAVVLTPADSGRRSSDYGGGGASYGGGGGGFGGDGGDGGD